MEDALRGLGLAESEIRAYLALLDLGECSAAKLAQAAGLDRVNTYQIVEKLMARGFVSCVLHRSVKHFVPANPALLLRDLEARESHFRKILPLLQQKYEAKREETSMEVLRGVDGFSAILRMILRDKAPYAFLGGIASMCSPEFEERRRRFVRQAAKDGIAGRFIEEFGKEFFVGAKETYRYVRPNYLFSTTLAMWADKMATFVWSPPYYVTLVTSAEVARRNLVCFDSVWEVSKEPPAQDHQERAIR